MPYLDQGFQSESLRVALKDACAGKPAELERVFSRLGGVTAKPNLRLAAAFGVEIAAFPGAVAPLLNRLGQDDAAPDTDRVFLPIAAAHGWAGCVRAGRDVEAAWTALADLAADERALVRIGTCDALVSLALRDGGADVLVLRALSWLDNVDLDWRLGTAALAIEALGDRRIVACVRDPQALLAYLSRVIDEVADAPRSAERSDARRRVLRSLPRVLTAVVLSTSAGSDAPRWFEAECARAEHPHVREALSDVIIQLRTSAHGLGADVVDSLHKSLASSAKPLRDPSRLRPGTGRGKASRRTR
jgi:hypothetical protein